MCKKIKDCLCHLIKPAIQTDEAKKFKAFCEKSCNSDLYHFLEASYPLLQEEKKADFIIALQDLVIKYINYGANETLNLNYQERDSILSVFNSCLQGKSEVATAKEVLASLTYKQERLLYETLIMHNGFVAYLKQYENEEAIIRINKEPPNNGEDESQQEDEDDENLTSCCKCTLF